MSIMIDIHSIKRIPPVVQTCIGFLLGLGSIIVINVTKPEVAAEFMGVFTGILFFILINCLLSLFHPSFQRYTLPSFLFYILLLAGLLQAAKRFSGESIWNHGAYQGMAVTLSLFYVVLSFLARIIRAIYHFTTSH